MPQNIILNILTNFVRARQFDILVVAKIFLGGNRTTLGVKRFKFFHTQMALFKSISIPACLISFATRSFHLSLGSIGTHTISE